MFSFFKKKKNNSPVNEYLKDFQNEFNKKQKVAIISSLILIAKSDGVHPSEMEFIERTIEILNIDVDDELFIEFAKKDPDYIIKYLDSLSKTQKEWYVVAVHGLVSSDGKANKRELDFAFGFCDGIGITEDEYIQIIKKTDALSKNFSW